jgi:c-di-GMP-binding flagellar brake protein YcgR
MPPDFEISILYRAISENSNLLIKKVQDSKNNKFFSRFLHYDLKSKIILLDFPTSSIPGEILKKSDKIKIFFNFRQFRFIIFSGIISKTRFKLRKDKTINSLKITLPDKLFDGERRNFFRVTTPPFPVMISIQPEDQNREDKLAEFFHKAILHEIAGGGMGIREDKNLIPLRNGDLVELKIQLDNELLQMEGMVRNSRTSPYSNKRIFGIEFDSRKIPNHAVNKNVRKILRYVMKRQRELLK